MGNSSSKARIAHTPPLPEKTPELYSKKRLKKCVQWADLVLKDRAKSAEVFNNEDRLQIMKYKVDAEKALSHIGESHSSELAEARNAIRLRETNFAQSWYEHRSGHPVAGPEPLKLLVVDAEELKDLRLKEVFCRYGDYFGDISSTLREAAKRHPGDTGKISGKYYWTEISAAIKKEETSWEALDNLERKIHTPFTYAVYLVNNDLNWDFENTILAIHMFAERNRVAHTGLDALLKAAKPLKIADVLYNDAKDLDRLCPSEWEANGTKALLERHISGMIDKWFAKDTIAERPHPSEGWNTTPELEALMKAKVAESEKKVPNPDAEASRQASKHAESDEQRQLQDQLVGTQLTKMPLGPTTLSVEEGGKAGKALKTKPSREAEGKVIHEATDSLKKLAAKILERTPSQLRWNAMKDLRAQQKAVNDRAKAFLREYGQSDSP